MAAAGTHSRSATTDLRRRAPVASTLVRFFRIPLAAFPFETCFSHLAPSFPGPGGRPSPSQTHSSPRPTTRSQPSSPEHAEHGLGLGLRARTFSGFRRISMAVHDEAPPPLPPKPQQSPRTSHYPRPAGLIYASMSPIPYSAPPIPIVVPQTPRHSSLGSRSSYSPPSSAPSVKSVSPPATPTTPVSFAAERGVIRIAGEPSEDDLLPPFGLDVDPTPKPSPRPEHTDIPVAEHSVPMSPTAPKRARRKPVPRLDDDLVKRLEAIEV